MFTIQAKKLRATVVISVVALALALLSPAALAGQHGRYGGHSGSYGHNGYAYRGQAYRSPTYRSRGYQYRSDRGYQYRSHRGYRSAYRPVRYGHYSRHDYWGPGEVLGAVVAGAIITNVIADVFQPRTTIIERPVYRSSYPDYSRDTRYIGPDTGYYDDRR